MNADQTEVGWIGVHVRIHSLRTKGPFDKGDPPLFAITGLAARRGRWVQRVGCLPYVTNVLALLEKRTGATPVAPMHPS